MAERELLLSTEPVTDAQSGEQRLAIDLPGLRAAFEAHFAPPVSPAVVAPELQRPSTPAFVDPRPPGKSILGTLGWVLFALLFFAAAGWVLWKRSGG